MLTIAILTVLWKVTGMVLIGAAIGVIWDGAHGRIGRWADVIVYAVGLRGAIDNAATGHLGRAAVCIGVALTGVYLISTRPGRVEAP